MRSRLRRFRCLPLSGVASHSWRRRTFQTARFDIGGALLSGVTAGLQVGDRPAPWRARALVPRARRQDARNRASKVPPLHVTMVKKVLLDGSPCDKCLKAEELLKRRGLWQKIDEVVLALEADA